MKKLARFVTTAGMLAASTAPAFAQSVGIPQPEGVQIENIGTLISGAIGVALLIAGILVFVMLVWGGITWITAGGDKAKTEEARTRITNALVGLAIVAAAWAVMKLVEFFFGITVLGGDIRIPKAF
jgi:cytochrome bd-type quinol oxidase subunit 2